MVETVKNLRIDAGSFLHLGWRDLKSRYSQTFLGPWWSVATLMVVVGGSSFAISMISGVSAWSNAPRLAVGLSVWTLVSNIMIESSELYISEKSLLLNTNLSELTIWLRLAWRNYLIYLHNQLVVVVAFAMAGELPSPLIIFMIPIGVATVLSSALIANAIAAFSLRIPDLRTIAPAVIQFLFFLTPILWVLPPGVEGQLLLYLNPLSWGVVFAQNFVLDQKINWMLLGLITLSTLCSGFLLTGSSHIYKNIRRRV